MGEPTDEGPGPRTAGPATWVVLAVTGVVAVLVVGAIVAYRAWRDDGDDPEAAAPATAVPTAPAAPGGEPANRLLTRQTAAGIEVRVDLAGAGMRGMDFGMPVTEATPPFCEVVDQATVVAISSDEVVQAWLPLTKEAAPDPTPVLLSGMMGPGAAQGGLLGLVVQLADDATSARLAVPGAFDEMAPMRGIAALALDMPAVDGPEVETTMEGDVIGVFGPPLLDDVTLTIGYADGRVRHVRGDDLAMGPMIWRGVGECFEGGELVAPPGTIDPANDPFAVRLPPPGVQPDDPAAAHAAIGTTMEALYGADDTVDVLALVDDPFAMRETFDRLGDIDMGVDFTDAAVTVEELVFLSPVEAAFEYTLRVGDMVRDEQFGRARLVDGAWRIGRGTICRDLQESFGTTCPP